MIEENLKKLGFSSNEAKIYLDILRFGKIKAGDLIKETLLQRSVVYGALEKLCQRGLVGKALIRGVAVYIANDPEALSYEAEQQAFLAKRVAGELKEKIQIKDREVVVYEGEDIVKRVADKTLVAKADETIYFLGPSKFGIQTNLERYWQNYHKKRAQKGIRCKILYEQSTDIKILQNRNTLPMCEARYLPINTEIPLSFIINDTTVSVVVPTENPPLAFLIRSSQTAQGFKKYFEYLWQQSKE